MYLKLFENVVIMNYSNVQIVLQEVPGQISICFNITGCPLKCKGCHSSHLGKKGSGEKLTSESYMKILNQYKGFAGCVLFMGGEWHKNELIQFLKTAKYMGYLTCLYTGMKEVDAEITTELTWLKTGPWISELGGLESKNTNQKFIEVKTKKLLNHLFIK
ncbi:anaerobic ribonucleoside-triphosphate reductase activating protein [Abyssalbus ytuae]|uniref:Anaerobic ribonucleoside-triphosphate reductase activating protein n=1 Tax=Abyssalbus ytuae TaxID=2926907 RepID=A0A9E6ZVT6_9FLAO|nr:anaerobic ribonucleoside-triphosphate reductase activating protein [Abyssalbus ytuae]UOB18703.1 anaerobic ribonucleoside-triphosphate reductase activating protein [Abyssalbus ytuae]